MEARQYTSDQLRDLLTELDLQPVDDTLTTEQAINLLVNGEK